MKKTIVILTFLVLSLGSYGAPQAIRAQEPLLGEIKLFAGNFAPRGWAFCDGQLLPIAQNAALFSILGTTYGGDGRTTFALPDLRGRVPLHPGSGIGLESYALGEKGGEEHVTLDVDQMPGHNHDLTASTDKATDKNPEGNLLGKPKKKIYSPSGTNVTMDTNAISEVGGDQPHENRQPYLGIHFIIALQGIFPSRN